MCSLRFLLLASVAGAMCAQQGYNPADVQAGKQLYAVNCSHCHGPKGATQAPHGKRRADAADKGVWVPGAEVQPS